jgi:hypothetical protein
MLTSRFNLVPGDVRIAQVAYQRFSTRLPCAFMVLTITIMLALPLARRWRGICC